MTAARFNTNPVTDSEFAEGRVLIVLIVDGQLLHLDPADGAVMWLQPIGAQLIDGTHFDGNGKLSISFHTTSREILLLPETGEILSQ